MAHIPDQVVKRLKEEVDLAELVTRSGVALKRAGRDLVGRCPFHDDDTPSLMVTPAKGLWHCMGACQTGGTAIDWVMKAQGVSFRHAVELLRAGEIPTVTGTAHSTVRRLPVPVDAEAGDAEALAQVVAYYHATLTGSPEALAYLARRKIDDPEAIERFSLGYANRTLGLRLPAKNRKAGAELRGRLQRLGVYRQSGHEHLAGSVVVPVMGPDKTVTELYGRKILSNLRAGTPLHLYLPGPHRGVWNEAGLVGGEVILTESLIDALTLWCAGFRNVTAAFGTSGFTTDHHEAFSAHGVTRVLIAYDHDPAGDTAAVTLAGDLAAAGVECFRVLLPADQDINDVATGAHSVTDTLGQLVRSATFMHKGKPRSRRSVGLAPVLPSAAPVRADEPAVEPPSEPVAPATPVPPPSDLSAAALAHDELVLEMGPRTWRVRHIPKATPAGALKVNVMVRSGERFHVDTLDLYAARARAGFTDAAATELRTEHEQLTAELGRVLLATESAQTAAVADQETPVPEVTGPERERALALLEAPDLIDQVAAAFRTLGVIGERDSALVAWLTLTSRLSDRPLGAVLQSSSSAGKSTLADAALALVPTEATVSYSAMTGQALYYLGETDLAHKVLAIAEEEGAARATYALKLLVSEGRLAIAAAGKDPVTGRLMTHTYEVTGPVALLMTTTAAELDDELANRLLVLAVDEGRAQTRAVQAAQRDAETLSGLVVRTQRREVTATHTAAQRLLAPVAVVNPHAPMLGFSDRATRHRRDNAKYLGLIRAVALAHQHQRPRRQVEVEGRTVTYIEATAADVAAAERLCAHVLGTTVDELAPATRRLLVATRDFATGRHGAPFTRRELREATGMGDTQMKVHLARLVDLEYVVANRAGPATTYELAQPYDTDRSGENGDRSGPEGDRSAIGRFSSRNDTSQLSEATGEVSDYDERSVGIGRGPSSYDQTLFSQLDDVNPEVERDRSGLGELRVVGDNDSVAHVGA
ncbi:MAG: CHC2 zinc finger domain-containing protein [Acidimicrobiales bacterium]